MRSIPAALRNREAAGHAPARLIDPGRAAVDHGAARTEVDDQPRSADQIVAANQANVADERDELAVEIIDAEIAARLFGGAGHRHAAGGIEALDLNSAAARAARISD